MTFFCDKCSGPLISTAIVNQLMCDKCKCIYEIRVELRLIGQIHDDNIRKSLPAAGSKESI